MKRFIFPILWCGLVSLLFLPLFVFECRTHAESSTDAPLKRKVSKDIFQKVTEGKGGDFVRVIIPRLATHGFFPSMSRSM